MDIWYSKDDSLEIEGLTSEDEDIGRTAMAFGPIEYGRIEELEGLTITHLQSPITGDKYINLFINYSAPKGEWKLRIKGHSVTAGGRFHAFFTTAWRDIAKQPFISLPGGLSIGSIACGQLSVVVGAYDSTTQNIAELSSKGPTRDGRFPVTTCAPGVNLALLKPNGSTTAESRSGTSYSAPLVTGVIALMLAEAVARGGSLTAEQIIQILRQTSDPPPRGAEWDRGDGPGRVNAAKAVARVISMFPAEL